MTTTDSGTTPRPAAPRHRTLNVVRLQFVNAKTFIWIPALVFWGAWVLTSLTYWMIQTAGGTGMKFGGGAQGPLRYFLVVGVQAMTMTFPFSQAMSLTRREFFLGSLVAAGASALGMAVLFVMLGMLERATGGYGLNGYFAYHESLWEAGALAAGLTYFVLTMLCFIISFWAATTFKRYGTAKLVIILFGIALMLVGITAHLTNQQAWPDVQKWILDTGSLGLTLWTVLLGTLLAAGSYLTLRKMPA